MQNTYTVLFVLSILFITTTSPFFDNAFQFSVKDFKTDKIATSIEQEMNPIEDIVPQDDAYHGPTIHPSMEWWYFDSIFTNGYSAHIGFRIISVQELTYLTTSITLYKNNEIIADASELVLPTDFQTSEEVPTLQIRENSVMKLDVANWHETKQMTYSINHIIDTIGVNLSFTGTTTGWKYITTHEGWTVALPKATVQGYLLYDGKIIDVNGRGYHDHNWNFSLSTPVRAWGWYWGKITTEQFSFTWANIMDTGIGEPTFVENLGVLNTDNMGFFQISPDNITFTSSDYEFIDGRFIPQRFTMKIKQGLTEINVTMQSQSIHRGPPDILTLHYWRYFVTVNGTISHNGITNELNDQTQIIEYMRFI